MSLNHHSRLPLEKRATDSEYVLAQKAVVLVEAKILLGARAGESNAKFMKGRILGGASCHGGITYRQRPNYGKEFGEIKKS